MLKDPTKVQRLSGCHCGMLNGCKARIDASAFPYMYIFQRFQWFLMFPVSTDLLSSTSLSSAEGTLHKPWTRGMVSMTQAEKYLGYFPLKPVWARDRDGDVVSDLLHNMISLMYVGFTALLDRRLQSWWKLLTVDVSRSLAWSAVLLSKSRGCVTPGKQSCSFLMSWQAIMFFCSLLSSGWRKPLYSMSRLQLRMNTGFGPAIGEPLPFQAKAWAASHTECSGFAMICHDDHDVPLIQSGARIRWTASSSLSPAPQSILCQRLRDLRVTEEEWTNSLRFGQTDYDRLVKFARQFRVFLSHLTEFPAGSRQWMASAALWPLRRQIATRCHKPNSLHIDSMWPPSRAVSLPNNIKQPLEHQQHQRQK